MYKHIVNRIPTKLVLGKDYYVKWKEKWWWKKPNKVILCRLIQPTKKGFNLLNLDTNKCILPRHLYISPKLTEKNNVTTFYINENLLIKEK